MYITCVVKVAAHIQAPQMRAREISDLLLQGIEEGVGDVFANYANADMVGHAMTDPKLLGIKKNTVSIGLCLFLSSLFLSSFFPNRPLA